MTLNRSVCCLLSLLISIVERYSVSKQIERAEELRPKNELIENAHGRNLIYVIVYWCILIFTLITNANHLRLLL